MKNSIQDSILESGFSITHISKKTGVSRKTIYNVIQGKIPTEKTKNKIIQGLTKEVDWLNLKSKGGKVTVEAQYLIDLQSDKIKSQADKILLLEKQLINKPINLIGGNIPDWSDIEFDVKTRQTYKSGRYDTFEKYQMIGYQDFYKKLGYSELETKKYWKMHHKFMTSERTERKTNYNEIERMGFAVKVDKTDKAITDPKETQRHFEMAIKNNIVSQLQIYNVCYINKDGSEAHAVISVLFDFVNHQSESKIKFLTVN